MRFTANSSLSSKQAQVLKHRIPNQFNIVSTFKKKVIGDGKSKTKKTSLENQHCLHCLHSVGPYRSPKPTQQQCLKVLSCASQETTTTSTYTHTTFSIAASEAQTSWAHARVILAISQFSSGNC
eukprot:c5355_g1_i1.p1 GENE.c5355_g1_i1~~c5355_g1_i1.p1  ORF type:complete len:124 (-),score=12.84 c5355_g1_i1:37-408(-)